MKLSTALVLCGLFTLPNAVLAIDLRRLAEHVQQGVEGGGVTDRIVFKYKQQANAAELSNKIQVATGCSLPARIFRPAPKFEAKHVAKGLHLWYKCDCSGLTASLQKNGQSLIKGQGALAAVAKLEETSKREGVSNLRGVDGGSILDDLDEMDVEPEVAETVVKDSTQPEPQQVFSNDPRLNQQTHYSTIDLYTAWSIMEDAGAWANAKNTIVHVLDSGWDLAHEDSGGNKWVNPSEICNNGVDDDGNGFVDDCHGYNHADNTGTDLLGSGNHGSHCTGTISADTDNNIGVAGVAGGSGNDPGASIITSVGFGATGNGGFAEAIIYGVDHGAHISSNSWSYITPGFFDQSVRAAIDYAFDEGTVVVFAAGNDNSDFQKYPAYYDKVIAVAATNDNGFRASFSNYGMWVDISAPGVDVLSTGLANQYVTLDGTSMACPHVAGVLALGKSINPSATADELKSCLFSTADSIDSQNPSYIGKLGAGMTNAAAFLRCIEASNAPSNSPAPSSSPSVSSQPTVSSQPSAVPSVSQAPSTSPSNAPSTYCETITPFEVDVVFDQVDSTFPYNGASSLISIDVTNGHWCDATIVSISPIDYSSDMGLSSEYFTLEVVSQSGNTTEIASSIDQTGNDCTNRTLDPYSISDPIAIDQGKDTMDIQLTTTVDVDNFCNSNFVRFKALIGLVGRDGNAPSAIPSQSPTEVPSQSPSVSSQPTVSSQPSAGPTVSQAPSTSPSKDYCGSITPFEVDVVFDQVDSTFPYNGASSLISIDVTNGHWCDATIVSISPIDYSSDMGLSSEYFTLEVVQTATTTEIASSIGQTGSDCANRTLFPYIFSDPIVIEQGKDTMDIQLTTTFDVDNFCDHNFVRFKALIELAGRDVGAPSASPSQIPTEVPSQVPSVSAAPSVSSQPSGIPSISPSMAPTSGCEGVGPYEIEIVLDGSNFPFGGSSVFDFPNMALGRWCDAKITNISSITYNGDFGSSSEYFNVSFLGSSGSTLVATTRNGFSSSDCIERVTSPLNNLPSPIFELDTDTLAVELFTSSLVDDICSQYFVKFDVTVELMSRLPAPSMAPSISSAPSFACDSVPPRVLEYEFSKSSSSFPYGGGFATMTKLVSSDSPCDAIITNVSLVEYAGDFGSTNEFFSVQLLGRTTGVIVSNTGVFECNSASAVPSLGLPLLLAPGQSDLSVVMGTSLEVDDVCGDSYVRFNVTVEYLPRIEPPSPAPTEPTLAPSIQEPTVLPTSSPTNLPTDTPFTPTVSPSNSPSILPSSTDNLGPICVQSCGNCDKYSFGTGCECADCQNLVCGLDNYCCDSQWDRICAQLATTHCQCTAPTESPSGTPSAPPSQFPSEYPSEIPSPSPSETPSWAPSATPSALPTRNPTRSPSMAPTSAAPSRSPVKAPTANPTTCQGTCGAGCGFCHIWSRGAGCSSCTACESVVCAIDSDCCNVQWTEACAEMAKDQCSCCQD